MNIRKIGIEIPAAIAGFLVASDGSKLSFGDLMDKIEIGAVDRVPERILGVFLVAIGAGMMFPFFNRAGKENEGKRAQTRPG